MGNVSLRTKMLGGIGAILAVLCGLSVLSWLAVADLRSRVEDLDAQSVQGTVALANAQDALWQLRYGFPQFMVLDKPEDKKKIVEVARPERARRNSRDPGSNLPSARHAAGHGWRPHR